MERYLTLKDAILACNQNNECGVITDYDCDGYCWATCRGNHLESSSSRNSCSWIRPQFGKFQDFEMTSGLIIIYTHNKNIRIHLYVYLSFYVPLIRRLKEDCQTSGGSSPGSKCVFPFSYKGMTYTGCTTMENSGAPWCAISYHNNSIDVKHWSNCGQGCKMQGIN